MGYSHTQKAPLHWIFYPLVAGLLVLAWLGRDQTPAILISLGVAATLLAVAFMFQRLTVRDEGTHLAIRYGPLPVFWKRILYADIRSAEPSRSSVIDGWGIHYIPGRGYTYNLWGFECVKLLVQDRVVRIGSDDVTNLVAYLRDKMNSSPEQVLRRTDWQSVLHLMQRGGE